MDLYLQILRATSVDAVREIVSAQGRINDDVRCQMIREAYASALPKEQYQEAFECIMGPLQNVLNQERCQAWWDTVLEFNEAIAAAVKQGLPLRKEVMHPSMIIELIEEALKNKQSNALLMWGCVPEKEKPDMVRDMLMVLANHAPPQPSAWMDRIVPYLSGNRDNLEIRTSFFLELLIHHVERPQVMVEWMLGIYSEGLSPDDATRLAAAVDKELQSASWREDSKTVLTQLESVYAHAQLEKETPSSVPRMDKLRL